MVGSYVDPAKGRTTVEEYYRAWSARQPWRDSSRASVESLFAHHVLPPLGRRLLGTVRPGLRRELSCRPDVVNFLARNLTVDRQLVTPTAGQPTLGPLKTARSYRTLPLTDVVVEDVAQHLEGSERATAAWCSTRAATRCGASDWARYGGGHAPTPASPKAGCPWWAWPTTWATPPPFC